MEWSRTDILLSSLGVLIFLVGYALERQLRRIAAMLGKSTDNLLAK
jgi:hypothetical protein